PTLGRWLTAPFRARRTDVTERVAGWIRSTPPQGYVGCCHAIPKINVTDRLATVTVPALVLVGDEDQGTPVDMHRDIHAALPTAELTILRRAAHISNLEQPDALNRTVGAVLSQRAARTSPRPGHGRDPRRACPHGRRARERGHARHAVTPSPRPPLRLAHAVRA